MTATVLPFPQHCRRAFVVRQARHMARISPEASDRYLARITDTTRATLLRKGVSPALADREARALANAIRASLYGLMLNGIA